MVDLRTIAADVAMKDDGVWETYHTHPDGDIRVKIASADNEHFRKALRHDVRKQRKGFRADSELSEAANEARDVKLVATHIIRDWEGVQLDGVETPYSLDVGIKVLSDPAYQHFYDWIWAFASDVANYLVADREDRAGNSPSGSSGSSITEPPTSSQSSTSVPPEASES